MAKVNYKLVATLLFLMVSIPLLIVILNFVSDNLQSSVQLSFLQNKDSTNNKHTFYIAWHKGAFGRDCKGTACNPIHSFKPQEAIELDYLDTESMPEWLDVSHLCSKSPCYLHRSVLSSDINAALITPRWEDRMAKIVCYDDENKPEGFYFSSGSGLLSWSEGQEAIITAKHIVTNKNDELFKVCEVRFPDKGFKLLANSFFRTHDKEDLAILIMGDFGQDVEIKNLAKETIPICQSATRRDEFFILGYPLGLGDQPSIDDGIISQSLPQENYYESSKGVSRGYSGGIVVSKVEDCYMGIPIRREITAINNVDAFYKTIILKSTILNYVKDNGFSL